MTHRHAVTTSHRSRSYLHLSHRPVFPLILLLLLGERHDWPALVENLLEHDEADGQDGEAAARRGMKVDQNANSVTTGLLTTRRRRRLTYSNEVHGPPVLSEEFLRTLSGLW